MVKEKLTRQHQTLGSQKVQVVGDCWVFTEVAVQRRFSPEGPLAPEAQSRVWSDFTRGPLNGLCKPRPPRDSPQPQVSSPNVGPMYDTGYFLLITFLNLILQEGLLTGISNVARVSGEGDNASNIKLTTWERKCVDTDAGGCATSQVENQVMDLEEKHDGQL